MNKFLKRSMFALFIILELFFNYSIQSQVITENIIDLRTKQKLGSPHFWEFKPGDSKVIQGNGESIIFSRAQEILENEEKAGWIKNFPVQFSFPRYIDENGDRPFGNFNEYYEKYKGYAWYRTSFQIKPEDFKNKFHSNHITLRLGKIGQSDAVYLNGVFIGSTGLDENTAANVSLPDSSLLYDKIRIYKIPRDLIHYDRMNVIAVRTFSKYYIAPGLSHDRFYIAADKKIERSIFWDDFKKIFLITLTTLLGIFYIYWHFLFRKEEDATLYFAFGSFAMAINTLMKSQIAYSMFTNGLWIKKLEFISFVLVVHLVMDFILKFSKVNNNFTRFTSRIWHVLAIIAIISIIIIPDLLLTRRFMFAWGILPAILMINLIYLIIKAKKIPAIGTVAIGLLGMVVLLFNDVLVGFQFKWVTWETSLQDYAYAFFSMSVAASIVSNMIKSREMIEKQNKEKERLSKYFSPDVMKTIITDEMEMGGVEKPIATLFADISGFTSYSEKKQPAEVVEKLNLMFEKLSDVIFQHRATLDKYIGDCIMAFWGAPKSTQDDAYMAVSCGVKMQNVMESLRKELGEDEMPFRLRIGVNYGNSIVGNIGSQKRMDYTVIGDAVNTASRIESNGVPGKVAISEATFIAAGGEKYLKYSEVKDISVKGKTEKVKVYIIDEILKR